MFCLLKVSCLDQKKLLEYVYIYKNYAEWSVLPPVVVTPLYSRYFTTSFSQIFWLDSTEDLKKVKKASRSWLPIKISSVAKELVPPGTSHGQSYS
jgi:leucyl-tRNA synthetase